MIENLSFFKNLKQKVMMTITKEFLKISPEWKKAGWKVGDLVDMCTLDKETLSTLSLHPPKKPGNPK